MPVLSLLLLGFQLGLKTYGRVVEKENLHQKLKALHMEGRGGAVVITALAGMGKTHMMHELRAFHSCIMPGGEQVCHPL